MVSSRVAFAVNEARYGKGEYNIEVCDIEVMDFISHAYPGGIGTDLDMNVLERYGLAISFARLLKGQEEFSLSVPFNKERNVYCGHILGLPILKAKIIIDSSTVEFLSGGFNSFMSLSDGHPIASAYVRGLCSGCASKPLEVYFRKKVIPAP